MQSDIKIPAQQHIFLLSHMRANSSLIGHILGSHPQIKGYFEMHQSYCSVADLITQEQILDQNKELSNITKIHSNRYVFDKLLHNKYALLLEHLTPPTAANTIKILVSIRAPQQSIKSIINLFRNKQTQHSYAEPESAIKYYHLRIQELAQFCEQNKQTYYYYDADLIRTDTANSLPKLQNWLDLETPLKEKYQLFSLTGKPRMGDSSENMSKGEIVKDANDYSDIEIPAHLLEPILSDIEQYRKTIITHAIDSITD